MTGRLDEAGRTFDQVISLSRPAGDITSESWALVFAAELKGWEANFDEASRLYAEGVQLARAHHILVPVLEGLFMWGINLTGKGDYDRALAVLQEGLALAEKVGDANYTPRYLNSLGWLYIECGDLAQALDLNQRAAEGARQRRDDESIANAELNLADIQRLRGDLPSARDLLDGVLRRVKDPATSEWMRWRYSMHLFASLADLRLGQGDPVAAREAADQCLELAVRTNSRKYLVAGWRARGDIAVARRQWDEARTGLQQALGVAQQIGAPSQLVMTHCTLGRLHTATKAPGDARRAYHAARTVLDRILSDLRHPGLRASLEGSLPVREIRDHLEKAE
jgi:tetratricopeptide (TPR) repeat protein